MYNVTKEISLIWEKVFNETNYKTLQGVLLYTENDLIHSAGGMHLKENFTLIVFSLFHLNWRRKSFCNAIYNFFFSPKLIFQHHLHKIYIAFYLLTWIYFNGVNVDGNILTNSQLKITLLAVTRKNGTKLRKTEKTR